MGPEVYIIAYIVYYIIGFLFYGGTVILTSVFDYKLGYRDDKCLMYSALLLPLVFGPLSFLFLFMPYSKKVILRKEAGRWILIRKAGPFTCRRWIYWTEFGFYTSYWFLTKDSLKPMGPSSLSDLLSMQGILERATGLKNEGYISGIITVKQEKI